LSTEKLMKY